MSETRTLEVTDGRGKFRVTIPADWKVTFSGFNPGAKYPSDSNALRIYEAENKQRACFVGVRSFFDIALPITREVISEEGEVSWTEGPEGVEETRKVKRSKATVDGY